VGSRHGHGSLGGGHGRSRDTFPTVDELREILPAGVFEHSLDGAATAAYVYLTFVSESYADLDRPADTSVINAMAGESCGWCANHIQRVHSLAGANVRVTDYTLTDSALGQFAAGEVEAGDVVVEAPIRVGATKVWNPDGTPRRGTNGPVRWSRYTCRNSVDPAITGELAEERASAGLSRTARAARHSGVSVAAVA